MKSNVTTLLLSFVVFFAGAQHCATNPLNCTPTNNLTTAGFPDYNTFPCLVNGVSYGHSFEMYIPALFNFGTTSFPIDSIRIDSIKNLPCGVCWNSNKTRNVVVGGEHACLSVSGLPDEITGTYKASLYGTAFLPGGLAVNSQLDFPGFGLYFRVIDSTQLCASADTVNTKKACTLHENCTIPGIEFVQLAAPNSCFVNGDTVVIGVNKRLDAYQWAIIAKNQFGVLDTTISTDSTIVWVYDSTLNYTNFQALVGFSGTLAGCTYNTTSPFAITNIGLVVSPKFCYADRDSNLSSNVYHIYFQKNNVSNPLIDFYTATVRDSVNGNTFSDIIDIGNTQPGYFEATYDGGTFVGSSKAFSIEMNNVACVTSFVNPQFPMLDLGYFILINDSITSFPTMFIGAPANLDIKSLSIHKRKAGGNWSLFRQYYVIPSNLVLSDGAPDSTAMEYKVSYEVSADCNPSRATTEHLLYYKQIAVPDSVVKDSTANSIPSIPFDNIRFLPNPTTGFVKVNSKDVLNNGEPIHLHVYNTLGEEVYSSNTVSDGMVIDISSFSNGLYFFKLASASRSKGYTIMKQH